ncbi:MAG: YIP1 family protein [bacterium]
MAIIHIARNQQTLGSFSEEEVREGICSGRFAAQDLAWKEGMEIWKPLGEMAPQWGLETPPPIIEDRDALRAVDLKISGDGTEPAWEQREKLGFFPAISQTLSAVLMRPTETFERMKHEGGLVNPLLYFVLLSCTSYAASVFYQMVSLSMQSGSLPSQLQHLPKNTLSFVLLGTILISPALYVISAFISSGITHLSLKLIGGANRPFETTFRVVCYAQASAAVFNFLPLCGGLMAILWGSYTIIIGLMQGHGISGWRATVALLLPGLFCCGVILILAGAGGFGLAELSKEFGGLPHLPKTP